MKKYLVIMVLVLVMVLNGCSITGTVNKDNVSTDKTVQRPVQPIELIDFAGRKVAIQKQPLKIVSLSPAVTEILYSLGYGEKIVAVTEETLFPADVKRKVKVGRYADIDIDAVKKSAPDIVFASKYTYKSMAESLQEMNIPVVYAEAETYIGIFDSVSMIGSIFNESKKALELVDSIKQKVALIREEEIKQKPNVLYIQSLEPLYVAGSNTLINDEIWLAGGANAAQDLNGYSEAKKEDIFSKKIDVIVISKTLSKQDVNLDYIRRLEGFVNLDSVKNGKVYVISDEDLAQTSGVRIAKAIEQMKSIINK